MEKALKNHLKTRFPYLKSARFIIAVSGGRDSMALAHLMHILGYEFAVAHCNFRLRGKDSDADAAFVENWAQKRNKACFVQDFDTQAVAKTENLSIQMAARRIRYEWFATLQREYDFAYVLTAHHANDTAETFLINLSRGTGLDGLLGIPEENGNILRPLLPFSREQINAYLEEHAISWREDTSNDSDKYLRNHLRHHAVPALKDAAPHFMEGLATTLSNLKATHALLNDYMALVYAKVITESFEGYQLDIGQLKKLPHRSEILYELLKPFHFTAWEDIHTLLGAQPGKSVYSPTHRLTKDRGVLILTERKSQPGGNVQGQARFSLDRNEKEIHFHEAALSQEQVPHISGNRPNEAFFCAKDLNYPLIVRKWCAGDYFYPFGMRGKKKLSKYFKDEKLSVPAKENIWLLCNGNDIIWVMGHRTDERYRIPEDHGQLIKFTFEND